MGLISCRDFLPTGRAQKPETSHLTTAGIGGWSDAEIKRAITKGVRPDGTMLKAPMSYASYDKMTDDDLNAIVAYLRSLPPRE